MTPQAPSFSYGVPDFIHVQNCTTEYTENSETSKGCRCPALAPYGSGAIRMSPAASGQGAQRTTMPTHDSTVRGSRPRPEGQGSSFSMPSMQGRRCVAASSAPQEIHRVG